MSGKVLIITYYWPPSGGGGVQRWLKFSKFLPEMNWQTTVFTPENPEFDLKDDSLKRDINPAIEVIKFPIWEPFGLYKKLFAKSSTKELKQGVVIEKSKLSFLDKIVIWIRGNCFIPDPRKYWVKPSVKFLTDYVIAHDIDVVITTGPPHSMHLIGLGLKRRTNVKWIADFRDPWSDWDILEKLRTTWWAKRVHKNLERKVLEKADVILTVTNQMKKLFVQKSASSKINVITNGIDDLDLIYREEQFDVFRITHLGLLNELRNPAVIWQALENLCERRKGFEEHLEIVLAGTISQSILDEMGQFQRVWQKTEVKNYVQHEHVFDIYLDSSMLLLLMNRTSNAEWLIPGKLFEYMSTNREIMALGSTQADVNEILINSGGNEVLNYENLDGIESRIEIAYVRFLKQKSNQSYHGVEQYYRRNLTSNLSDLMNELIAVK